MALDAHNEREERTNIRMGTVAAAAMNAQGGKEGGVPWTWKDFFGTDGEVDQVTLKERIRAVFQSMKERRK